MLRQLVANQGEDSKPQFQPLFNISRNLAAHAHEDMFHRVQPRRFQNRRARDSAD